MRFKNKLNEFTADRLLGCSLLIALAETICHIYEFITEGNKPEEAIKAGTCLSYIIFSIFCTKRNTVYLIFSIFALIILFFNKYTNYTSFFIIALTVQKIPQARIPLLIAYGLDVIACLILGHRMAHQAIIHILNCLWIFTVLNSDFNHKKLKLTPDEIQILEEMKCGKEIKEIELFTRNTVFKKLKEARERNKIKDNEMLLNIYTQETKEQQ